MPEEGFLKRWSRLKATGEAAEAPVRPGAPVPAPPASAPPATIPACAPVQAEAAVQDKPLPTLEDAARLTPDADFSSFVARDVDKSVQRLALKKLFADPHFHVMDGLDMYMDDYNKPSPVSAAMLAALDHARSALRYPDAPDAPDAPDEEQPADEAVPDTAEPREALAGPEPTAAADTDTDPDARRVGEAPAGADNATPPASPQPSLQGQA